MISGSLNNAWGCIWFGRTWVFINKIFRLHTEQKSEIDCLSKGLEQTWNIYPCFLVSLLRILLHLSWVPYPFCILTYQSSFLPHAYSCNAFSGDDHNKKHNCTNHNNNFWFLPSRIIWNAPFIFQEILVFVPILASFMKAMLGRCLNVTICFEFSLLGRFWLFCPFLQKSL